MGDFVGINDEEAWPFRHELLLYGFRQMIPNLVGTEWCIQQESSIRCYLVEYIVALEKARLMTADKIGFANQVSRPNWSRAESQMRNGHRSRLLRVVDKITLSIVRRVFANDLDGFFVSANGPVGAKTVEHRAHDIGRFDRERAVVFKTGSGDVICDSNGEVVLWRAILQIVEHGLYHSRRKLLRG